MVTDMLATGELDLDQALATSPSTGSANPREIAAAVLWLCSPDASFIIGPPSPSTAATPPASRATHHQRQGNR
ncbi:hypothetical protein [Kribbella caucasensis]|uniref:hypothetical protein n=1 Tax=Kribbella caucasensis TaxID=2512215 RepID=UPI00192D27F6